MIEKRAIVIGGGIAGMCAARALSDFFDKVILIERDKYPEGVSGRIGVPQSRMFHTLLERGRREVEALFPGFHALMDRRGAPCVSFGFNAALMSPRGWGPPLPFPRIRSLFTSRGLLECTMRDLFRQVPNVDKTEGVRLVNCSPYIREWMRREQSRSQGELNRKLVGAGQASVTADDSSISQRRKTDEACNGNKAD